MPESTWIYAIIFLGVVVLAALIFGRKLEIWHGKSGLKTGADHAHMKVSAVGRNSSAKKAKQTSIGGTRDMDIEAKQGGQLEDIKQRDDSSQ